MSNDTLKKLALVLLVLFLLFPIMPRILHALMPVPMSISRFENELLGRGMVVLSITPIEPPQSESIEQVAMYVNNATVVVYKYDDEGHIVKQMEYQKPDSGSSMVEAMGIAQSLGAKVSHQTPSVVTRHGMFMLVVSSEDKELNSKIAKIFEGM